MRFTIPNGAAALAVAATLLLPASGHAGAGSLDRGFDGNGRLAVKADRPTTSGDTFEVTRLQPFAMASAAAPDGEMVVANSRRVIRLRADGRARRYFGGNGRAVIPPPAGTTFQLAGVVVDPRGRALVAGTTKPLEATGGSRYARAAVYRFMPNGKLDAGFGNRGLAGARLGPMEATGLAVDSRNRPILTGFVSAPTPSYCNARTSVYLNTTVVARLTTSGAPDSTFGAGNGIYADRLEDPWLPTVAGSGTIAYVSAPERRCAGFEGYPGPIGAPLASVLSVNGGLVVRVPVRPPQPYGLALEGGLEPWSLAVDRKNRIVILMTAYPPEGGDEILQEVHRLLPDGSPDPEWKTWIRDITGWGPEQPVQAVTTDSRNRVILAGSSLRREGRLEAHGFAVQRLNAAGEPQSWFGDEGVANAWFGRRSTATATQVHIDSRGRIVLGGTVETLRPNRPPTDYRLAFARFLSGRR